METKITPEEFAAQMGGHWDKFHKQEGRKAASSAGDPHYVGWNGKRYDVMPVGDAIILKTKDGVLEVHGRHKKFGSYPTCCIGLTVKAGIDLVEYDGEKDVFFINGKQLESLDTICQLGSPISFIVRRKPDQFHIYTSVGAKISVNNYDPGGYGVLAISISVTQKQCEEMLPSLLGSLRGGEATVLQGSGLFRDTIACSNQTTAGLVEAFGSLQLDTTRLEQEARRACKDVDPSMLEDCVFDYIHIPDPRLRKIMTDGNIKAMNEHVQQRKAIEPPTCSLHPSAEHGFCGGRWSCRAGCSCGQWPGAVGCSGAHYL